MNLVQRYRKLTLWNKIGVWASICTLVAFLVGIVQFFLMQNNDSMVRQILNLKHVQLAERTQADFPYGCILLGMEKGNVVYDSRLKDLMVDADWDHARLDIDGNKARVSIYFNSIVIPKRQITNNFIRISETSEFTEGVPIKSHIMHTGTVNMYYEVLDAGRKIFLIGFK